MYMHMHMKTHLHTCRHTQTHVHIHAQTSSAALKRMDSSTVGNQGGLGTTPPEAPGHALPPHAEASLAALPLCQRESQPPGSTPTRGDTRADAAVSGSGPEVSPDIGIPRKNAADRMRERVTDDVMVSPMAEWSQGEQGGQGSPYQYIALQSSFLEQGARNSPSATEMPVLRAAAAPPLSRRM